MPHTEQNDWGQFKWVFPGWLQNISWKDEWYIHFKKNIMAGHNTQLVYLWRGWTWKQTWKSDFFLICSGSSPYFLTLTLSSDFPPIVLSRFMAIFFCLFVSIFVLLGAGCSRFQLQLKCLLKINRNNWIAVNNLSARGKRKVLLPIVVFTMAHAKTSKTLPEGLTSQPRKIATYLKSLSFCDSSFCR